MQSNPTHGCKRGHPGRSAQTVRTNHGGQAFRIGVCPGAAACGRIGAVSSDPTALPGVITALAAGIVSFLSPCVLPLVPGSLSAVTGVAAADLEKADWRRVLVPSLLFVSSFSVIFILLGLGATGIGSALQEHQLLLDKVAAWVIIAMGVFFISALFIPQLNREWHVEGLLERAGTGGAVAAGGPFGNARTPRHGAD